MAFSIKVVELVVVASVSFASLLVDPNPANDAVVMCKVAPVFVREKMTNLFSAALVPINLKI